VISRFGVMFFPSPVDGVGEMLRVLKPGRKLALAVWHFAEDFRFDELVRSLSAIVFPFRSFSEQFWRPSARSKGSRLCESHNAHYHLMQYAVSALGCVTYG
jgi:hypothetical protein